MMTLIIVGVIRHLSSWIGWYTIANQTVTRQSAPNYVLPNGIKVRSYNHLDTGLLSSNNYAPRNTTCLLIWCIWCYGIVMVMGCITAILYGQLFETDSYWRHGITIKDGDLVLDIGANIGFYSLSLATQRKNLTILGTLS
jgi:hypothetical protein